MKIENFILGTIELIFDALLPSESSNQNSGASYKDLNSISSVKNSDAKGKQHELETWAAHEKGMLK